MKKSKRRSGLLLLNRGLVKLKRALQHLNRPLSGSIPEKIAYLRASDAGRALTETKFPSLNQRSDELVQSIINFASKTERAA
jgi:hypothetical protein